MAHRILIIDLLVVSGVPVGDAGRLDFDKVTIPVDMLAGSGFVQVQLRGGNKVRRAVAVALSE